MKLLVPLLLVTLAASNSRAAVFSGRMTASSYVWDRTEVDSTNTQHLQNAATLGLRLARIGGQDLEISTTVRGNYDKRSRGDDVDGYRIHDLLARWKDLAGAADLTLGRQRIFWPGVSAVVDGMAADIDLFNALEIGGYAGALAPADGRFRPTNVDKGHAFGARIVSHTKAVGNLSFSFAERRHSASYGDVALDPLASRIAGLDWRRTITGFGSLYGHLLYDLPRRQIGRVQFSARWNVKPTISVQSEYYFRRPSIAYNSIFWVFGKSDYAEGRLRLHWRPSQSWTFSAGFATIDVAGANARRLDLGMSHKYFSLMLHGRDGVAGNTVGVSGDVMYPLNEDWTIRGGSNYSSYELFEGQADSNTESAFWGGLRWQAWSQSTIDVEVQYLNRDNVAARYDPGNSSDVRFIARLSWWFFRRLGEQDGQS